MVPEADPIQQDMQSLNPQSKSEENQKLIRTIDLLIAEGQNKGEFDKNLSPSLLRQVLCGAIERVIYGLFFSSFSGENIGYKILCNRSRFIAALSSLIKIISCNHVSIFLLLISDLKHVKSNA